MNIKIGHGYDVHRLVENRKLIIGGVEIDYEKGLLGHSDADVLTHAIIDSLLGASGLGDIGSHFPDTDEQYKGMSSIMLLEKTGTLLKLNKFRIINIDSTVIAQRPKLLPYLSKAAKNISYALKIQTESVNIKATTEEGLGFTGAGEGIAAHSVCLIEKNI